MTSDVRPGQLTAKSEDPGPGQSWKPAGTWSASSRDSGKLPNFELHC